MTDELIIKFTDYAAATNAIATWKAMGYIYTEEYVWVGDAWDKPAKYIAKFFDPQIHIMAKMAI